MPRPSNASTVSCRCSRHRRGDGVRRRQRGPLDRSGRAPPSPERSRPGKERDLPRRSRRSSPRTPVRPSPSQSLAGRRTRVQWWVSHSRLQDHPEAPCVHHRRHRRRHRPGTRTTTKSRTHLGLAATSAAHQAELARAPPGPRRDARRRGPGRRAVDGPRRPRGQRVLRPRPVLTLRHMSPVRSCAGPRSGLSPRLAGDAPAARPFSVQVNGRPQPGDQHPRESPGGAGHLPTLNHEEFGMRRFRTTALTTGALLAAALPVTAPSARADGVPSTTAPPSPSIRATPPS